MLRIVVDTNLVVSAILTSHGAPAKVLDLFRKNLIEIAASEEIISEMKAVLNYPKIRKRHGWSQMQTQEFIASLKKFCIVFSPEPFSHIVVTDDPSDDKFLNCAVAGEVSYVVTGDSHLLELGEYSGIPIVPPGEFLQLFTSRY